MRDLHFPGAPFVLAGICLFAAMLIAERITRPGVIHPIS
jgi:hypothetical protein